MAPIALMDMTVDQIRRLPAIQQRKKRLKTTVGEVIGITVTAGRSVGKDDIHTTVLFQLPTKFPNAKSHLSLAVLVRTSGVAGDTAKPKDPKTFYRDQPIFNAIAALWGVVRIATVVIAMDIQQRGVPHGHKKG